MRRRILIGGMSFLTAAGLALAVLVAHALYTSPPLLLIVYMNSQTYPSPLNWAARQALFRFHPTPEEVQELNAEGGARYAAEFPDPAQAEAMLAHFLRHGVEIDSVDQASQSGWTALHGAAIQPHPQAVRLLLAHGANRDLQDRTGKTALDLARAAQQRGPQRDYAEVIALLEKPQGTPGTPGTGDTR